MTGALVRYDALRRALDRATDLPAVKDLRDRAEALRTWCQQAGEGLALQNRIAALAIRAERKAGTLLAEVARDPGGRPAKNSRRRDEGSSNGYLAALADLGLSEPKARRWQLFSRVPEAEFEGFLATFPVDGRELTRAAVLRMAVEARPVVTGLPPLPPGKHHVVLADPPWRYEFCQATSRAAEVHYPTMATDEICALTVDGRPVQDLFAADAVLFLWATNPMLPEALQVIGAWGCRYRTNWVWAKARAGPEPAEERLQWGLGYWGRAAHELLLIATRGSMPAPPPEARPLTVLFAERGRHSGKPEAVPALIERMYPDAARAELFARRRRPGWAAWGDEVPATAEVAP